MDIERLENAFLNIGRASNDFCLVLHQSPLMFEKKVALIDFLLSFHSV